MSRPRPPSPRRGPAVAGSALLEALVASGLLVVLLIGLFPLVAQAGAATGGARLQVAASLLAGQRLAEFAVLTHVRIPVGNIVRDEDTRLDGAVPFAVGGTGLREGSADALDVPEPGASEWLDDHGQWASAGPTPGPAARFLRQWSLVPGGAGCVRVWIRVTTRAPAERAFAASLQCPWGTPP